MLQFACSTLRDHGELSGPGICPPLLRSRGLAPVPPTQTLEYLLTTAASKWLEQISLRSWLGLDDIIIISKCSDLINYYLSITTNQFVLINYYLSVTTYHLLLINYYLSITTYHLLLINYYLSMTTYQFLLINQLILIN